MKVRRTLHIEYDALPDEELEQDIENMLTDTALDLLEEYNVVVYSTEEDK